MRFAKRPVLSRTVHALILSAAASLALLLILVAGNDTVVQAQTPDTPTPETTRGSGDWSGVENLAPLEGERKPPAYPNMDSNLNRIVEQVQTGQFTAQAAAAKAPLSSDESVAVTIYVTEGSAAAIVAFLESNGASPRNVGTDYIEAYVPVSLLPAASQREGVTSIRTIIPPQPAQGMIVSEGVAAHGVPPWHAAGIKGQGVKIGVIDVGFKGFAELMGSELPSTVQARCYTDIGVFTSNLADCIPTDIPESSKLHGTAVTEATFDIAPEAEYYIANTSSWGDLRDTVDWMIEHDVDVINMSLGWTFSGPGDGTTPFTYSPLRSVDAAITGGITWVNAAGNSARSNWFGQFADSNVNGFHVFSATGDECNGVRIELEPLDSFTAQLRWEDSWGGASSDLDLYLISLSGNTFSLSDAVAKSEEVQEGGADDYPFELISLEYEDIPDGVYCFAVNRYKGPAPDWIQLLVWGAASTLQHYTPDHSITNPAESTNPGLLAVGATGRNASIANPFDTTIIEPFSSQGPTIDDRTKPDIVGADAGRSVTYRSDRNPNGYFFGTSQASPHVAGLAALVEQNYPNYTPRQIANYLKSHAEDRGATGADNVWGHGFARLLASDVATPTPEPTQEPTATPEPTTTPPADSCVETLSAGGTVSGSWSSDCASEGRNGSYASYYTFTLAESAEITITTDSSVDTYLYLREGAGRDGTVLHENDDIVSGNTNSQIQETLSAGTYTIEVTTYDSGATGDFTLTVSGLPAAVQPTPTPEPTITITFGDLNWSSAMLQSRIAQYIAEKGYGYSTDVELGVTLPLFNALRNGDIDVMMEVWLPNQEEAWEEALAAAEVSSPGSSLGTDWQSAFVIPKYLQDQYPDLDSVEDLKGQQYKDLFKTAETGDKARLVSCVIGWACEVINAAQIEGYGLSEHVHIVNHGDGETLNADLFEAYENEEPWLGYQWGTDAPALLLDLVRLEEPAYNDECWSTTMACAYEDATILIGINAELSDSAAGFVDVLAHWNFNTEEFYKPAFRWLVANPEANTEAAALWWLQENSEHWSEWVTEDAGAAIQSALDAGEIPDGWPEDPSLIPEPTPEPTDQCVEALDGSTTISGSWGSDCVSVTRGSGSDTYARFYSFTLDGTDSVSVSLTSDVDTYLYIRDGEGKDGTILHENDDHDSSEFSLEASTDSGIVASLDAGTYTIEAATFDAGQTGEFSLVVDIGGTVLPPQDVSGVVVTAGPHHACSLNSVGEISCQGVDDSGQVSGHPTTNGFVAISVGTGHSCAIDENGYIECWGKDDSGQVSGHPTTSGFTAVSTGDKHSCAIGEIGIVECWGSDEYGQSSAPSHGTFVSIGSGDNYTCGLRSDDMLECWGRFEAVDDITPALSPTPSPTPTPGDLGSRSNPVPLGQHFRPPGSPWSLKVVSVDNDAWPEIQAEPGSRSPPADGNRYVLINIEVTNRGTNAESFAARSLGTISSSNVEFYVDTSIACGTHSAIPDPFGHKRRIFPGGSLQGNICTEVPISDLNSLLLFGDYYDLDLTDFEYRDDIWFWALR